MKKILCCIFAMTFAVIIAVRFQTEGLSAVWNQPDCNMSEDIAPYFEFNDALGLGDNYVVQDDGQPQTYGMCGEAASWSFDRQTGLLTISGQGNMYDYDYDNGNYAPWYEFCEEITDISVSFGITSIGNNSFRGLAKATGVSIPVGTVRIGNDSFTACHSLSDVVLPDGITSIGYNAFNDTPYISSLENEEHLFITPQGYLLRSWSSAEKIIIPNEVKVIASQAFAWAPCLSIEINSDCFICSEAFFACKAMTDVVVNGNCHYEDGSFVFSDSLVNFEVNGDVTSSGALFKFSGIQNIIINGSLLKGGLGSSCNTLKTIMITGDCNASVKLIDWSDTLETVTIGGNCYAEESVISGCGMLKSVEIKGNCTLGGRLIEWCDALESISIGGSLTSEDVLLSSSKSLKTVTIGGNCTLKKKLIEWCDSIEAFFVGGDCYAEESVLSGCGMLKSVEIKGNCTLGSRLIEWCDRIEKVTIGGDCTLSDVLADTCGELQNVKIGGKLSLKGGLVINCPKLTKISYNADRTKPAVNDNTTGKVNYAVSSTQRANVPYNSYGVDCPYGSDYGMGIEYNNGFGFYIVRERIQEIESVSGKIFAVYGDKDTATVINKDTLSTVFTASKVGFDFGGAAIDENYVYIMWSYVIPIEGSEARLSENNIVFSKYDMSGKLIGECKLSLKDTEAQGPLGGGNCNMKIKNGILGCFFNIGWLNGHQGSEFAAIDTDTMQQLALNTWQGSHSFGTCLLTTKYGFAGIQMGDCYPRGINLNTYTVNNDNIRINTDNKVIMNSSGQYADEGVHQNNTHLHMGGFAVNETTYAVVGKAERFYTSGNYRDYVMNHPGQTQIFDVFIRIVDQTLLDTDDIGGEDRIDALTGEIADTNVFWLTSCNSTEKAGQVKVVTLENGAYCVLWEKMVNEKFDSIRYVIMDECGNILRRETAIYGARLSNTSIQPIVQGSKLIWAIADAEAGKVTWYTVNLDAFGDVNKDGVTTLDDAVLTLQKAMKVNLGYVTFDDVEADITCDGEITLDDAIEILKIAMNVVS